MQLNQKGNSVQENNEKIDIVAKKTGLTADTNNVDIYCNAFYFNQR